MFSLITGFINWYFSTPTYSLLIVGEEGTGKTVKTLFKNNFIVKTFLEHLKQIHTGRGLPLEYISPTYGQNSKFKFIISFFKNKFRNLK